MRRIIVTMLMLLLPAQIVMAQSPYTPDYLPFNGHYSCDSLKIDGRWGWHNPPIADPPPADEYEGEFSFLSRASAPAHPYIYFLVEQTPGERISADSTFYQLTVRDNNHKVSTHYNYNAAHFHGTGYADIFSTDDIAAYLSFTEGAGGLSAWAGLDFYACYYTDNATPEPTPTPTQPPATPTPTPTTSECATAQTEFGNAGIVARIDGYHYTADIPPDTTSFTWGIETIGGMKITATGPNGESQVAYSNHAWFQTMFITLAAPAPGLWNFYLSGNPIGTVGNAHTYTICWIADPPPTPTPTPQTTPTPTPTPAHTPTPPATSTPPIPAATPTPAIWPTSTYPTPEAPPTPAGCIPPDFFCGGYFAPVDGGDLAKLELTPEKTYCYQIIPPMDLFRFPGLTLCLDTFKIEAKLLDVVIPVVVVFTVMGLIVIYKIIQS